MTGSSDEEYDFDYDEEDDGVEGAENSSANQHEVRDFVSVWPMFLLTILIKVRADSVKVAEKVQ